MASIKLILTDDNGTEIGVHSYTLGSELTTLSQIEEIVESTRPQLLCDITHDLLEKAQSEYKKKQKRLSRTFRHQVKNA